MCGNRVAVTSMDGSIKVYDLIETNNSLKANLVVDSNHMEAAPYDASAMVDDNDLKPNLNLDCRRVKFNPKNNAQLITGQLSLQFVSIAPKSLSVKSSIAHNKYINCLDFAPNGDLVATGDIDGQIKIFNQHSKELLGKPMNNHGRGVKSLCFSPDSTSLISGGEDLHMHMIDVET